MKIWENLIEDTKKIIPSDVQCEIKMINSIILPLLVLGSFVAYRKLTRKKRKFHAPPSHQLPS